MKELNQFVNEANKHSFLVNKHVTQEMVDAKDDKLHVGDILYYDAGWNRSLPIFVQITSITGTGASCKYKEIEDKLVSGSYNGYGEVIAVPDEFVRDAKECTARIKTDRSGPYIKVGRYYASKWDGKPKITTTD